MASTVKGHDLAAGAAAGAAARAPPVPPHPQIPATPRHGLPTAEAGASEPPTVPSRTRRVRRFARGSRSVAGLRTAGPARSRRWTRTAGHGPPSRGPWELSSAGPPRASKALRRLSLSPLVALADARFHQCRRPLGPEGRGSVRGLGGWPTRAHWRMPSKQPRTRRPAPRHDGPLAGRLGPGADLLQANSRTSPS